MCGVSLSYAISSLAKTFDREDPRWWVTADPSSGTICGRDARGTYTKQIWAYEIDQRRRQHMIPVPEPAGAPVQEPEKVLV